MSWYEELDRWTADYLPDVTYEHDVPLARYASFRIGGPARRMAFPRDGSQMVLLMEEARACGAAPLVIGNGTNLLFPDVGLHSHWNIPARAVRSSGRRAIMPPRSSISAA